VPERPGQIGEVLDVQGAAPGAERQRAGAHRPVVGGVDDDQVVGPVEDRLREAIEDVPAPVRTQRRPCREGVTRGRDRGVDDRCVTVRDVAEVRPVHRRVHRVRLTAADARTVDQVVTRDADPVDRRSPVVAHRSPSCAASASADRTDRVRNKQVLGLVRLRPIRSPA
jgi:hypothetical protein